ncbi:hypothetical protein LJK87_37660 [Paenibacillus sp. P25]|nr:hypothetical protein LJK87_37660 [Paenibacillus sp. P25]
MSTSPQQPAAAGPSRSQSTPPPNSRNNAAVTAAPPVAGTTHAGSSPAGDRTGARLNAGTQGSRVAFVPFGSTGFLS